MKKAPVSSSSLNSGDSFVLDAGRKLFVWNGKEANERERAKAIAFAQRLSSEECGDAPIAMIGRAAELSQNPFGWLTDRRAR